MASPDNEWESYKATYNKKYEGEEDEKRRQLYYENRNKVIEHNKRAERGDESYTIAINQFSDQYPEELKKCCGVKMPEKKT